MSEVNETNTSGRRYLLQAIDVMTDCPLYEAGFSICDVDTLIDLIGEELDLRYTIDLSPAAVTRIVDRYKITFDPSGHPVRMRPSCTHDSLPYRTHTGRELLLMLKRVKPLAVFDYTAGEDFNVERFFDPYVEAGRFVKREYSVPIMLRQKGDSKDLIYRYVLYALPHEQWRIDAYILLRQVVAEAGWSTGLERMEGALLGYEKWQNDIFIEHMERVREERRKRRKG